MSKVYFTDRLIHAVAPMDDTATRIRLECETYTVVVPHGYSAEALSILPGHLVPYRLVGDVPVYLPVEEREALVDAE